MIDILRHDFVQNAFLAGVIVAIISGFVGYFVVLRGQAFACEALSHIGFAGALGAALVGVSSLEGMFVFTLLAAIGMGALGKRLSGRDIEVGMVLSFVLGLGVLFLSIYTKNATGAVGVLFGSILSVTINDVQVILGSGVFIHHFDGCSVSSIIVRIHRTGSGGGARRSGSTTLDHLSNPACAQRVRRGQSGRRVIGLCAFSSACRGG